jgi:hypothetical protein
MQPSKPDFLAVCGLLSSLRAPKEYMTVGILKNSMEFFVTLLDGLNLLRKSKELRSMGMPIYRQNHAHKPAAAVTHQQFPWLHVTHCCGLMNNRWCGNSYSIVNGAVARV